MSKGFSRVIAESILYQAFLLSTRKPFAPYFHVEEKFVMRAERLLIPADSEDPTLYATSSPVLGIPTSLYRLKLDIINFYNSPAEQSAERLAVLRSEMEYWEELMISVDISATPSTSVVHNFDLVILATSLLLDLVTESFECQLPIGLLSMSQSDGQASRWQIDLCLGTLRQPEGFRKWTRCFLGTWPLLVLGHTVSLEEDMVTVRLALEEMRRQLGYGEVLRIQQELESVWATKRSKVPGSGGHL